MQEGLQIIELQLTQIKPYEKNARKHGTDDVGAIVNSIQEFGFSDPIGVWGDANVIVEGHGRYEAAKRLGLASVPCIRLDHLTDEQRKAYALAHNKTAELSKWDPAVLASELADLSDFDMAEFGFDVGEFDEDALEEMPTQTIKEEGEIDLGDFSDDKFAYQCPKCGFRFSPKEAKNEA